MDLKKKSNYHTYKCNTLVINILKFWLNFTYEPFTQNDNANFNLVKHERKNKI